MITLVVSGFQTGTDIASIRAAHSLGIPTSGFMPLGFKTEAGPRPDYARLYGAREHASSSYPPRTLENVRMADATLWHGSGDSAGYGCTVRSAREAGKPFHTITHMSPEAIATAITAMGWKSLNCAGNRASLDPGIEQRAEALFREVFRLVNGISEGG